mgnify:CR=1 FL=1
MPIDPHAGGPTELPLLSEVHRLDRRAELIAPAGFHLDKRDVTLALHDQIDIAMSTAKSMRDHTPSVATHPARRNTFAQQPKRLSLFGHGPMIMRL